MLNAFFDVRHLPGPDGRPLYAYRVTDEEYAALEADVVDHVKACHAIGTPLAATFCLYAAERAARDGAEDWWKYSGLTARLGTDLDDDDLRDAILHGLRYWKRPVHTSPRGREFIATVVCEGGLPLSLVQREGTRLREYFADLLRHHETYPTLDLAQTARELARGLPQRMQNAVVYDLASKLIAGVARMRKDGATIDAAETSGLPLRLDRAPLKELLDGLTRTPRAVVGEERGIVVLTELDRSRGNLLRRRPVLPAAVSPSWLRNAVGAAPAADLPPRLYLAAQVADGARQQLAVAILQGETYLLVSDVARDVVRADVVEEQLRVVVTGGSGNVEMGSFVPRGGEALSSGPWSFEDTSLEARLCSTGDLSTPSDAVLVAWPSTGSVAYEGDFEDLGPIRGLQRGLVRVRGGAAWTSAEDVVHIRTGTPGKRSGEFQLVGARPGPLIRNDDLWLGPPDLREIAGGVARPVPSTDITSRRAGESWQRAVFNLGAGEVRVIRQGRLEFRARIRVVPDDLTVHLSAVRPKGGVVQVRSRRIVAAGAAQNPDYGATVARVPGGFDLDVIATAQPPARLCLRLRDADGFEIDVEVPFPAEYARFLDRAGRPLPFDSPVSLDELAHVRAVAVTPRSTRMSVELRGPAGIESIGGLLRTDDRYLHTPLEPLRSAIAEALALTEGLDGKVTLRLVQSDAPQALAQIAVRRYDGRLFPSGEQPEFRVELDSASIARLGPEVVAALHAEAVPLLEPDRTPVLLGQLQPGVWSVSQATLSPGMWLVLAMQRDYLRARPLRVTVEGTGATADAVGASDLERAMAIGNPLERRQPLLDAIAALPADPTCNGWPILLAMLGTLGRLPVVTFDAIRLLPSHPRVAVLGLLNTGEKAANVWSALEELPFLWATVSVREWMTAIRETVTARVKFLRIADVERIFQATASGIFGNARHAFFLNAIHDAAFVSLRGIPEPAREHRIVFNARNADGRRAHAAYIHQYAKPDLLRRHAGEDFWPDEPPWCSRAVPKSLATLAEPFNQQPNFQKTVLLTPLQLAERAVEADTTSGLNLPALRRVRSFDPIWFDDAYAMALGLLLGHRLERKESPFAD